MRTTRFEAVRLTSAVAVLLSLLVADPSPTAAAPGTPPEIALSRTSLATANFGEARVRGTEHRLAIRGPSSQSSDVQFRWALDYSYQRYEYEGLPSRNRDLHRLELPLSWHGEAAYSWTVELRPVIASSSNVFKEIWSRSSSADFMLHGRAMLERSPGGSGRGWRLGAARDDAFGRESIYPVVAFLRQQGGARIELGWPVSRAILEAGRGIELGGELAPAGARWHVVSDERDGASFDYKVRAWRASAIVRSQLAGGLLLTTRAGLEFERRHRLEDDTGAAVNRGIGEATFFELSASFRW
jgi:hypothetical protein